MIRYHGHRIIHKNSIYGLEGRRQTWTWSRVGGGMDGRTERENK